MKFKFLLLSLGCLVLLGSCNLLDPGGKDKEPAYHWRAVERDSLQFIYDLALRDDETLVVNTDEGWYSTRSLSEPLQKMYIKSPLSLMGVRQLVAYDSTFYAFTHSINTIWSSTDGNHWRLIFSKKDPMFDLLITPEGNRIVGTWHGIYRQARDSSDIHRITFLYTNYFDGLDQIKTLTQTSSGALFCGSHDGVYRSLDTGLHWKKVSSDINKEQDDVVRLYTNAHDRIFAQTRHGLYSSDNNGEHWIKRGSLDDYVLRAEFPENGTVVVLTNKTVWQASLAEGDFKKVGPNDLTDLWDIGVTKTGKMVISTDSLLFIGVPNPAYQED